MFGLGGGPRGLEGRFVEVVGLPGPVEAESLREAQVDRDFAAQALVDANGKIGRVVWWIEWRAKYMVHLFENAFVAVPEENLREFVPPAPEDGGFDLAWPSNPASYPDFALAMSDVLEEKGWCFVQLIASEELRRSAAQQAATHRGSTSLREEFVTDYLGRHGRGKVGFIETEVPDPDRLDKLRGDPLSLFDRNLTNVAAAFAPIARERLGFPFGDRTKGMLWLPYASATEEDTLRPQPLNDEDIEANAVADHIRFLQRRKLCLMTWLENDGGSIDLIPRPDGARLPVTLPLSTKKLLVFRSDEMTFEYRPRGSSVVLQAWLRAEQPRTELRLESLQGDAFAKAEALGIHSGRPFPDGDQTHIMALHCRLPGDGCGSDEYWAMLVEGTDGMCPIPFLRWDTDVYCTKPDEPHIIGKCYAHHGGFCTNEQIFAFDHQFFGIEEREVAFMSPSQRIMLEDGYTVLYKGGHTASSLAGRRLGVFIGDTGSDWWPYQPVKYFSSRFPGGPVSETFGPCTTALVGANQSVTASRLSHAMDMRGPVGTADTACSSSLVATGIAMSWMRPREFDPKLKHIESRVLETVAGGVCVQIGPGSYIGMCALSMISPQGRCFTFDESGDGYARGEGLGLVYMRNTDDDSDRLRQCACLLSAQINQDGRSASMTAPNGPSQQACIQASMREAGNQARDINLAECHGTGTALGDPIEVGALRNAMEPRDTVLALTSSKSNIGHLEGSAGIAGLLKCIVMLAAGTCPPNAHCGQLNPHLSVSGFPCFFDTEVIDTLLNSALTGVSSFGFGGTNGRCDIWGQAKFGPRKSGEIDPEAIDQITVTCPITLARIDHITGEPAMGTTGMAPEQGKYRADVLRDEFAPYDISRFAYQGGFRYRRAEIPDDAEVALPEGARLFVCGSWSAWSHFEEMERQDDGWYQGTFALGETRCEMFDLCLDQDPAQRIYPVAHKASRKIWVQGPDNFSQGQKWLVDGRDEEVPAGTLFHVYFRWGVERKEVYWEEAGRSADGALAIKYEHNYSIVGDFSKWKCTPMTRVEGREGVWEGFVRIGGQGKAEFQLVRDDDMQQVIYPSQHRATSSSVPARGPDDMGKGKHFQVRGHPGDSATITLTIADASVSVVAASDRGVVEWRSRQGWQRHDYCAIGTFHGTKPLAMSMDPGKPGLFRCMVKAGTSYFEETADYGDFFQVVVDGDILQAYYPESAIVAVPHQVQVQRPDGIGSTNRFCIRCSEPGLAVDIFLDLNAEDRRKTVSWAVAAQDALADG